MAESESIERMHFFNTQFLVADDFITEQNYHSQMRYRHALEMHTSGVVRGLEVSQDGALQIEVSDGMAVDGAGREIVLFEAEKIALADIDGFETSTTKYLYVTLAEEMAGGSSLVEGEEQWTRRLEVPAWILESIYPSESTEEIPLAKIVLSESEITEIEDRRTFAGPRIPDGSIGEKKIATGAVNVDKLDANFKLDTDHISDEAIVNAQLAPGAVTVDKLDPNFKLGKDHIAERAVDNERLAPRAITVDKLDGNFELTKDHIAAGAVDKDELAPGAVTVDKLDANFKLGTEHIAPGILTNAKAYVTFDSQGQILNHHNVIEEGVKHPARGRYQITWAAEAGNLRHITMICWPHMAVVSDIVQDPPVPAFVLEEDFDLQKRELKIVVMGLQFELVTSRPPAYKIEPIIVDATVSVVIF